MDKIDVLSNDLRVLHFHEIGAGLLAEALIELGYRKIEGELKIKWNKGGITK